MAKLSEQIRSDKPPERITRTQRVAQQQKIEREKKRFENLKKQAKNLQETDFADVKSVDEYEKKYTSLKPELRQFFQTPKTVRAEKQQRIEETKSKLQERQQYADERLEKEKKRLERSEEYYERARERAREKRSKRGSDWYSKRVDRLKESLWKAEDRFEEKQAYWDEYKKGLREGISELEKGKEVSYSDIKGYASDLARQEERETEAKIKQKEFERKQRQKIEDLEEKGYKPIVVEKSSGGKVDEAYLTYLSTELGKSEQVAKFKPSKQIDVGDLEKSQFGRVPVGRKLQFAGKEYDFTSNLQLYEDKGGKLSTRYGDTGITLQPKGSYVNAKGQGMSITEENLLKGIEEGKLQTGGTFRSSTGDIFEITQKKSNLIDERTGKPYGFVDIAPTNKEIYQREIGEKGYVKGTLSYLAGKFESKVLSSQFKRAMKDPDYELYQPYATGRLARFSVETLPYFTPVGIPLLLGSGTEAVVTKAGRERIKAEEEYYFDEKEYNKIVSKTLAYGKPALEIGVGLLGLRQGYKGFKASKEQRLFEKTPTTVGGTRVEGTKGGIDIIYGLKDIGKTKYISKITQPYSLTKGGFVLEKGKSFALRSLKGSLKKIKFSYSDITGRGTISPISPKYTKSILETPYLFRQPRKISQQLKGFQAGYGRILTTERLKGILKIRKGWEFPRARPRVNVIAKYKRIKSPETVRRTFGGIGKEQDGIISVVGGRVKNLRIKYDKILGNILNKRLKVNIENVGRIRKINLRDLKTKTQFDVDDLSEINKLALKNFRKTTPTKTSDVNQVVKQIEKQTTIQPTGYQQEAVEQVMSKLIPKVKTPKTFPIQTKTTQTQLPKIKQQEILKTTVVERNAVKEAQQPRIKTKTLQRSKQEQKSQQKLKTQLKQLQEYSPAQLTKNRLTTAQLTKQLQKQKITTVQIPLLRTPITPRIRKPIRPIIPIIPKLKPRIERIVKKKKKKQDFEKAYLPDFTSRALGLQAETITEKQAQARLKKIMTGFEVRRGVRIK